MKLLKLRIKESGLKQKFIAEKIGVSAEYFSMMLNDKVPMPENIRNKVNEVLQGTLT